MGPSLLLRITKTLVTMALYFAACTAFAGELARDATVVEVVNNYYGTGFAMRVFGTGICAAGTYIVFPETKAPATANKAAIATALIALSTGKKVRIHNYEDDSCAGANFISISN